MNVLLINGSPTVASHTEATLTYLAELFEQAGRTTDITKLLTYGLPINDPLFHDDATKSPIATVVEFAGKVKQADIIVLGTPLYHGSFSGLLKTALDNLDGDAFEGKQILMVSNSYGDRGAPQGAHQLTIVPRTIGGIVNNSVIGTCNADFEEQDGVPTLANESIKTRCQQIVSSLTS